MGICVKYRNSLKYDINSLKYNTFENISCNLSNSFMFAIVMRDEELCAGLLQRIIPERKISQIRFPDSPLVNVKFMHFKRKSLPAAIKQKNLQTKLEQSLMHSWKN